MEKVDRTPVWFMRQAGRYLPEYRELRERHPFLEVCADAELTARVTLQPLNRFDLDAAIVFSDILLPLIPMGAQLEFVTGKGPVIHNPVRTAEDVRALLPIEPEESLAPTLEAVRAVRNELAPEIAVIGFAGAPFTLASYLVEGGPSKSFAKVKAFMAREPEAFASLMERLACASAVWLRAQLDAGADAVQLFDSWAGCLDVGTYDAKVAPYSATILAEVAKTGRPSIHFAVGSTHLLPSMARAGGDMVGVDWRLGLDEAWARTGEDRAIQGNLDPAALLAPTSHLDGAVRDVMGRARRRPGHVFNLGHGVLPETPPDSVARTVEAVRRYEAAAS